MERGFCLWRVPRAEGLCCTFVAAAFPRGSPLKRNLAPWRELKQTPAPQVSFERNKSEMLKRKPSFFSSLCSVLFSNLRGETGTGGWGRREDETRQTKKKNLKTWFALPKIMHETATHLATSGRSLPGTQAARWIPKIFVSRSALSRAGTLRAVFC